MTRTPIPNCPQEDKPIRDRAWTDEQRLARLRDTAEQWKSTSAGGDALQDYARGIAVGRDLCSGVILSILDAEGDGGDAEDAARWRHAVADDLLWEDRSSGTDHRGCSDGCCGGCAMHRVTTEEIDVARKGERHE